MKHKLFFTCLAALNVIVPLYADTKVLIFAGSTRNDSYNKQLANEAAEITKQMGATVTIIDLSDYPFPFYDADLEAKQGMPENAKKLRNLIINHQAIIIASPEYNASIPAVLKNALDWVSRNEQGGPSRDAFNDKNVALISASPSKGGGSRGLPHLRAVVEEIGGKVIPKQVTIPSAHEYFAQKKRAQNTQLKETIEQVLEGVSNKNFDRF